MSGIIISKLRYFSLAKVLAMYGFLITSLTVLIDLIYKLITHNSYLTPAVAGWGSWVVTAVVELIVAPIAFFIVAYVLGFLINIALKTAKGLEFETR